MKLFHLFMLSIAFCFSMQAQSKPKITRLPGYFNQHYLLGEDVATKKEIDLHLKNHCRECYKDFGDSRTMGYRSILFGAISLGGIGAGVLGQDYRVKHSGWTVGILSGVVAGICHWSQRKKNSNAVKTYNRHFGY